MRKMVMAANPMAKNRTLRVFLLTILFVFVINLIAPMNSNATLFRCKYSTGRLTWRFRGSVTNKKQQELMKLAKKWSKHSSKLKFIKKHKNYKYARFRVRYCLTKPPREDLLGQTFLFKKNGTPVYDPNKSNWWKATVSVYKRNDTTAVNKKATFIHEVGHTLGLAHCDDNNGHEGKRHIMHSGIKNFTKLSKYDIKELKRKWGK